MIVRLSGRSRPPGVGSDRRRALAAALRPAARVSVGAVSLVLVIGLFAPSVWARWSVLPFVVGLVVGVPHGAVDHLVPWWTAASHRSAPAMAALLVGYVTIGAAAFVVARVWPAPALAAFLLVSVGHFGTGETAVRALRDGEAGASPDVLGALARGAVPVVVPLAVWTPMVRPVVLALAPDASWLLRPAVLGTALGLTVALAVAELIRMLVRGRWRDAGELVLVAALFVVVPPLAAFGVWFGCWHGLRHLMRMVATDPANVGALVRGSLARPVARFARHAALPTAGVLAVLVLMWSVPAVSGTVLPGVVSVGLALVFALTVPHLVVVAALDARQVSSPGPPATRGP